MTQGNSRNQVKEEAKKPSYGMHFVDFKSHIILMKWLALILEREQDITPHLSAEITEENNDSPVSNLFTWFRDNEKGALNPHIFDRFARKLNTFDYMLIEKMPIREILSSDYLDYPCLRDDTERLYADTTKLIDSIMSYTINMKCSLPPYKGLERSRYHFAYFSIAGRLRYALEMSADKSIQNTIEKSSVWWKSILAIDPYFYQIYFFISSMWFYMPTDKDQKLTMLAIDNVLSNAEVILTKGAKDKFYYLTLILRIKSNFLLLNLLPKHNPKQFNADVQELLESYRDDTDPDYWRIYAFRAIIKLKQYFNDRQNIFLDNTIYEDFSIFLKHVEPEESIAYNHAVKYMKETLRIILPKVAIGDHALLIKLADIYHCLGKYKPMLISSYKAVIIIRQNQLSQEVLDQIQKNFLFILQTYCSYNKLNYSEYLAMELWDDILSNNIKNEDNLFSLINKHNSIEHELHNNSQSANVVTSAVILPISDSKVSDLCRKDDLDRDIFVNGLEILSEDIDIIATSKTACNHLRSHNFRDSYNADQLHDLFQGSEYKIDEEQKIILFYIHQTLYKNQLLNIPDFLVTAKKIGGIKAINNILALGEDQEIAEQILLAVDDIGLEKVLEIFFSQAKPDESQAESKIFDPTLETIAKIETIIGKDALAEITGWYKYASSALSNNPLSASATKVIQIIGNLINNLEEWLDFGIAYESIDIGNQVTVLLTQLEHWFDFVASGTTYIGLPPRYPGFDPDDDNGSGSGDGDQSTVYNNTPHDNDINKIDFSSLLFLGQNNTTDPSSY
jgi:hypothetical protein